MLNKNFENVYVRQSIRGWTKQVLWKRAFKKLKGYGLLKQTIPLQFFKSLTSTKFTCPLLNTLSNL